MALSGSRNFTSNPRPSSDSVTLQGTNGFRCWKQNFKSTIFDRSSKGEPSIQYGVFVNSMSEKNAGLSTPPAISIVSPSGIFRKTYNFSRWPRLSIPCPMVKLWNPLCSPINLPVSMSTNVPRFGAMYSDMNSLKGRLPTKQMPILSFFFAIALSPTSAANRFTSDFKREPIGNMVRRNAFCGICDKKKVWSFLVSTARSNFAPENWNEKSTNNEGNEIASNEDEYISLYLYRLRSARGICRRRNEHNVPLRLHQPIMFRAHNGRMHWIWCVCCNLCRDSVFRPFRIPWGMCCNWKAYHLIAAIQRRTRSIRTRTHRSNIA